MRISLLNLPSLTELLTVWVVALALSLALSRQRHPSVVGRAGHIASEIIVLLLPFVIGFIWSAWHRADDDGFGAAMKFVFGPIALLTLRALAHKGVDLIFPLTVSKNAPGTGLDAPRRDL